MFSTRHQAKLLALAVLLLLTIAAKVPAADTNSTQALQRLTNDLALQLELTYRHDLTTHRERYAAMAATLGAWNRSRRTDADFAQMEQWLHSAIRNSMPGDTGPLPPAPEFSVPRRVVAELPAPRPKAEPPKTVVVEPRKIDRPQAKPAPAPQVTAKPKPSTPPAATGKPEQRDFWSNHPAARPLDTTNPFRDDPLPEPDRAAVATAEPPTPRTAMRLPVIEIKDVGVNLPELSSRISGYNQSLRRIEAAVIAADRPDGIELAKLLAEMEQLGEQRDFIDLYIVGLSPQERAATPKVDSSDAALALLSEKIDRRIASPAGTTNSTERDILHALARKVSELRREPPATP